MIICDPSSTPVADQVVRYLRSVHTPRYESNVNAIINPDLVAVQGVVRRYWICVRTPELHVEAMTALQQTVRDEPAPRPTRASCSEANRGEFWTVFGVAGVADRVAVCAKDEGDQYAWRLVY